MKYKTFNKKIVKVTSKGKITATKKGKAKITCVVTVR
ncbi:Ig-like domain-containing protein [Anaerostipes hadrus]